MGAAQASGGGGPSPPDSADSGGGGGSESGVAVGRVLRAMVRGALFFSPEGFRVLSARGLLRTPPHLTKKKLVA